MKDYYHRIVNDLIKLRKEYPEVPMGRHLSTIIDGQDVWGTTDKQLSGMFDEYMKSNAIDRIHSDTEIDKIIEEGMCLDRFKLYEDAELTNEE